MKYKNFDEMTDVEKIRYAKNAYQREWRAKNKVKAIKNENNYWLRRFEQLQSPEALNNVSEAADENN